MGEQDMGERGQPRKTRVVHIGAADADLSRSRGAPLSPRAA
jgi:hypothetical protein